MISFFVLNFVPLVKYGLCINYLFREIQHFIDELTDYIIEQQGVEYACAQLQADAMVRLVFSAGAEALEADDKLRREIGERVKAQLRFVQLGATQKSV